MSLTSAQGKGTYRENKNDYEMKLLSEFRSSPCARAVIFLLMEAIVQMGSQLLVQTQPRQKVFAEELSKQVTAPCCVG